MLTIRQNFTVRHMSIFIYKARDNKGNINDGRVEAPSETVAAEILAEKGLDILVLSKTRKRSISRWLLKKFNRISPRDLVIFTRQLAVMVSSNVP